MKIRIEGNDGEMKFAAIELNLSSPLGYEIGRLLNQIADQFKYVKQSEIIAAQLQEMTDWQLHDICKLAGDRFGPVAVHFEELAKTV